MQVHSIVLLFVSLTLVAVAEPGKSPLGVAELIDALGSREASVRREAARTLGELKDNRAVGTLIKTMRDPDDNVRFYAAYALGEIRDARSAQVLLGALSDPVWGVRDQAAWALRELKHPGLIVPLVDSLADDGADVAHIMWILAGADFTKMAAPVTRLLRHSRVDVRLRAVDVLECSRSPDAITVLQSGLRDSEPMIRLRIVAILLDRRDRSALTALEALADGDADAAVRALAAEAVLQLSRHAHLAAHWNFDDQSETVARDVGGRGVDGEIKGCKPVPGKMGYALQFGRGRYVEFGRPARLPVQDVPFSVMAWVKSETADGVVIARGGASQGYSLYLKDGAATFGIHRTEEGPGYVAVGAERVVGRWVHLAGVVRPERIDLFVDGTCVATTETSGLLPGNCGQGMQIGFDVGNSAVEITDNFTGMIDDVRVYDDALSGAEIVGEAGLGDD